MWAVDYIDNYRGLRAAHVFETLTEAWAWWGKHKESRGRPWNLYTGEKT